MSLHFEPIEVKDVLTDVDEPVIGAIIGRNIIDQQGSPENQLATYHPLDTNLTQLPIIGEVVMGVELAGKFFYMSKFNIQNSPIGNVRQNISSFETIDEVYYPGKYFAGTEQANKKLVCREGDTIIQGRFGNSIRLGSNQYKDFGKDEVEYVDSPNVKIVSGRLNTGTGKFVYDESLDKEINSIYLTTKEEVKFNFEDGEIINNDEPQMTLQSDNIVLHGREKFNVYTKEINLGGENTQPVVLGNELEKILDSILTSLSNIVSSYAAANPGASTGLTADVNIIKQQVNKILSKKVNTE
jgi:hypothetical protein|tara:strand:- start:86 stop:979 length:894 start_codon:yes stop_codon:yes gene_type:complete